MSCRARRRCLSRPQLQQLWRRWREGESINEIAAALSRSYSTVHGVIHAAGGFAPRGGRSARSLQLAEREEISRGLSAGSSIRQIARELNRAASTVSREIARHGGRVCYRAERADARAMQRARRPKACRLSQHAQLRQCVAQKLALRWSPQQISHWLEHAYAGEQDMRVSPETIYRTLFIQARGALKRQLSAHLRMQRGLRLGRQQARTARQGQILGAVSIRERPAAVEDRAVPGHWEGDLLCGSKGSQIATLVERHSRFVMLVKLSARDSATVVQALSHHMGKLPVQLRGSLTWDRGLEMAAHRQFSIATELPVYFCDPRSPWQRGSNENTNGLLRQYFPKGTDLSVYSQTQLDQVALELNQRPRMTLGWQTPQDKLSQVLQ
jgi:IS30 family transposase